MPLSDQHYSLLTVLSALGVGYVLGRVHAAARDPRRAEERKRATLAAGHTADDNLRKLSADVRPKIESLIGEGKLIEAIREVRLALNIGLKEGKDVVDLMREKAPSRGARAP